MTLSQHPLSAAFPAMPHNHLDYLAKDIAANGQHLPITLFQGMVLDGWHRYQACQMVGINCKQEDLPEGADPVAFVRSRNLHRRDMTPSQRAAAVVACSEWAKLGTNQHATGSEPGSYPQTASQMATTAEVSVKTIQQAKVAQKAGLGEQVRDGVLTAKEAAKQAKQPDATSPASPPKPLIRWSVAGPMLKAALEQIRDAEDRDAAIEMALRLLDEI